MTCLLLGVADTCVLAFAVVVFFGAMSLSLSQSSDGWVQQVPRRDRDRDRDPPPLHPSMARAAGTTSWSQLDHILFGSGRVSSYFPPQAHTDTDTDTNSAASSGFREAVNYDVSRAAAASESRSFHACVCWDYSREPQHLPLKGLHYTTIANSPDEGIGSCYLVYGTYQELRRLQRASATLSSNLGGSIAGRPTLKHFTLVPNVLKIDHLTLNHFKEHLAGASSVDLSKKEIHIEYATAIEQTADAPPSDRLNMMIGDITRNVNAGTLHETLLHFGAKSSSSYTKHAYADHFQRIYDELVGGRHFEPHQTAAVDACDYRGLELSDHQHGSTIRGLHTIQPLASLHLSAEDMHHRGNRTAASFGACYLVLLAHLASYGHVINVALRSKLAFSNNLAKSIVQSGSIDQVYPFSSVGLNGSSEVIGVGDTGVDESHCFFSNADGSTMERSTDYLSPITDHSKRKIIQYISYGDNSDASGGHGSHVCGTALGSDINNPQSDLNYGHASGAKLAFFDMSPADGSLIYPQPMSKGMFAPAQKAGAHIYSGSWGADENIYSADAVDIDSYSFSNDDFLMVIAAGNEGSKGYYSVVQPGIAKNALTVGASQTGHGTGTTSDTSSSMGNMAFFSSIGPSFDYRFKPDVVAPGYFINSVNSGSGCGFKMMAGTSMSTPLVAGVAAQVRQYFRDTRFWATVCNSSYPLCHSSGFLPRGATVKATIIHSGSAMTNYVASSFTQLPTMSLSEGVPDYFQGFGRVFLPNVLVLPNSASSSPSFDLFVHEFTISSYRRLDFVVDVHSSSVPLKVTIVWMDPPNSVIAATMLLNDINLKVTGPTGDIHWGNGGTTADSKNNVEQVIIAEPALGIYTVTVFAYSLVNQSPQKISTVITSLGYVTSTFNTETAMSSTDHMDIIPPCIAEGSSSNNTELAIYLTDHDAGGWNNHTFAVIYRESDGVVFYNGSLPPAGPGQYRDSFYMKTSACLPSDGNYLVHLLDTNVKDGGGSNEITAGLDIYSCGVHLSKYSLSGRFTMRNGQCRPTCSSLTAGTGTSTGNDVGYYDLNILLIGSLYGVPYGWHDSTAYKLYDIDRDVTVAVGTLNTGVLDLHSLCVSEGRYEIGFSTVAAEDDWPLIKYDPAEARLYGIEEYLIEVSACGVTMDDIFAYRCGDSGETDDRGNEPRKVDKACIANTQFVQFTIRGATATAKASSGTAPGCHMTVMLGNRDEDNPLYSTAVRKSIELLTIIVVAIASAVVAMGISYAIWKTVKRVENPVDIQNVALFSEHSVGSPTNMDSQQSKIEVVTFNPQHMSDRQSRTFGHSALAQDEEDDIVF